MRRHRATALAASFLAGIVASGCAFTTARLALDYQPAPGKKSPLSAIPPRVVALTVNDERPADERDRVGNKKNSLGMVTAPVQSTKDVSAVIFDALKLEFENNGHTVKSQSNQPDVIVSTTVKRYWGNSSMRMFDIEMTGIIDADIVVASAQNRSAAGSRPLTTTFREGAFMGGDGAFDSVLNKTLAEFVRNFSRDPTLLEALRSAK
jgi:uncharacterized lipoprotein YajG